MKRACIILVFVLGASGAQAAETAYKALRTVGGSVGQGAYNRVVEMRGKGGAPQPQVWTILLDEPQARGGIREFEVEKGRIISQRTPASSSSRGTPMNFQKLNLNSDGAFDIAVGEAVKMKVGFDSADFLLRASATTATPTWTVVLLDRDHRQLGSVVIAADTGTVLQKSRGKSGGAPPAKDYQPPRDSRPTEDDYAAIDAAKKGKGFPERAAERMERTGRHIGGKLEKFFTGRNTIDPNRPEY